MANPEHAEIAKEGAEATDTLIESTLKRAAKLNRVFLAYLLSVAAIVGGLGYLGYTKDDGLNGWEIGVGVLVTLLPLLATFFSLTLPAWRTKRREARLRQWSIEGRETRPGYFRIGPYEDNEQDRQDFDRADKAHQQALRWIEESTEPLLFLTGASGAGKSSLLNAHVLPHLRDGKRPVRIITSRSFDDPLAMLREQLLTPEVIWKQPPKVDEKTTLVSLLRVACEYLDKRDERLLVVFDQFEELLILHENDDPQDARPTIIEGVKQFLHAVSSESLPGLCVLLSLRTDYEGMLSRLELPPLEQGRNWLKVNPFTEPAAREFLAGGFDQVGASLLDRVMREAAAVEETRGLIRPITLNMLGTVLARMSGELSAKQQRGGLLAADLRRTLDSRALRDHARAVLAPLLTDAGTKHPRSVGQLQAETGLAPHTIEGCLLRLYDRGLVRRLNRPLQLADRVWEISHDFAARLLVMILHAPQRSVWRRLRPIAVPTSIAVWLLVFAVLLPGYIRGIPNRTAERLRTEFNAKVTPPHEGKGWIVELQSSPIKTLDQVGPLLHDLGIIESLDISNCDALTNVDGLKGLTDLQSLNIRDCTALTNVDGLQGLTSLQSLDLAGCDALTRVDGLQGMTELQFFSLNATKVTSAALEQVKGMANLESLGLYYTNVTDGGLEHLTDLTKLRTLDLYGMLEKAMDFQKLWSPDLTVAEISNIMGITADYLGKWAKEMRDDYNLPFPPKGRGAVKLKYDFEAMINTAVEHSSDNKEEILAEISRNSKVVKERKAKQKEKARLKRLEEAETEANA